MISKKRLILISVLAGILIIFKAHTQAYSAFKSVSIDISTQVDAYEQQDHSQIELRELPKTSTAVAKSYACTELGSSYWHNYIANELQATAVEKKWLTAVMECESGGFNCKMNYAGSGACGLFQFIPRWHPSMRNGACLDGYQSVQYALQKYRAGGQGLWAASQHCWLPKL